MTRSSILILLVACFAASASARGRIIWDGIVDTPQFVGSRADSLRNEITKLRRQLDELTKQLTKIDQSGTDTTGFLGWTLNSNGQFFGPSGLIDSNYFQKFPDRFDLHGNSPGPLREFRFNGKPINPSLPNFEYRIPAPGIPHIKPQPSTPAPDFPGWKMQWLSGKET
jgi:hypothetical protein